MPQWCYSHHFQFSDNLRYIRIFKYKWEFPDHANQQIPLLQILQSLVAQQQHRERGAAGVWQGWAEAAPRLSTTTNPGYLADTNRYFNTAEEAAGQFHSGCSRSYSAAAPASNAPATASATAAAALCDLGDVAATAVTSAYHHLDTAASGAGLLLH